MKWKKYTIETTTEAEDYLASTLMELGIEGIEIEDNVPLSAEDQADMFIDFLPELPPDEGVSHVSFYIEVMDGSEASAEFQDALEDVVTTAYNNTGTEILPATGMTEDEQKALLVRVMQALEEMRSVVDIGAGTISSSETEDLDWINNWKNFFKTFYIDDICIKPTWEELPEEAKDSVVIEIDPGISFGTGKHETTQLCMRQLNKYIRGNADFTPSWSAPAVLDLGCGSGILSIAALKLGAGHVVGTDLDPDCMISTRDNMEINHLDPSLGTFLVGNLTEDKDLQAQVGMEEYEIVVANILAPVIIGMAPVVPQHMKKGGYFITSGIIDFKEQEVVDAITAAGLEVVEVNHQGEWVNVTARKN